MRPVARIYYPPRDGLCRQCRGAASELNPSIERAVAGCHLTMAPAGALFRADAPQREGKSMDRETLLEGVGVACGPNGLSEEDIKDILCDCEDQLLEDGRLGRKDAMRLHAAIVDGKALADALMELEVGDKATDSQFKRRVAMGERIPLMVRLLGKHNQHLDDVSGNPTYVSKSAFGLSWDQAGDQDLETRNTPAFPGQLHGHTADPHVRFCCPSGRFHETNPRLHHAKLNHKVGSSYR